MGVSDSWLRCTACKHDFELRELFACPACGGELEILYDYQSIGETGAFSANWTMHGSLWERFGHLLPKQEPSAVVSLGEGNTPLVRSHRLGKRLGLSKLYFKLEACNPTGSFKDRQVAVAISKANEWGRSSFGTASSGNVGVALAAYCAHAGFRANVWASESVAAPKQLQVRVFGARLFLLPAPEEGDVASYEAIYTGMRSYCAHNGMVPMVSARRVNPYMVEGAKTISYEIATQLGRAPDKLFVPVGGGGLLGAMWKGFTELARIGLLTRLPRVEGAQLRSYFTPINQLGSLVDPQAFRPLDGAWAWSSLEESGGALHEVSRSDIQEAQAALALEEGIFAEPQGAYACAGLMKAAAAGSLGADELITCVVTGNGLKDMEAAQASCAHQLGQWPPLRVGSLADSTEFVGGFPHQGDH